MTWFAEDISIILTMTAALIATIKYILDKLDDKLELKVDKETCTVDETMTKEQCSILHKINADRLTSGEERFKSLETKIDSHTELLHKLDKATALIIQKLNNGGICNE
jgi:hypothetical protein